MSSLHTQLPINAGHTVCLYFHMDYCRTWKCLNLTVFVSAANSVVGFAEIKKREDASFLFKEPEFNSIVMYFICIKRNHISCD